MTKQRHKLKAAQRLAHTITDALYTHPHAIAGSIRRGERTVGDIDIVTIAQNLNGVEFPEWMRLVRGSVDYRRYAVELNGGGEMGVDIWRCPDEESWGGFMLFATGTALYNRFMRSHAKERGFKLNQRGLWRNGVHLPLKEYEICQVLELPYLTPQQRSKWETHHKGRNQP